MSITGPNVKSSSFPVGEAGSNVTTVTIGHRSGKLLAAGDDDHNIQIYLMGQMTPLLTSQCQTSAISALRFSNEEKMLASGSRSGALKICDLETQKVIYPGGHKTCIRSIEYFPSSNNFLATAAVDGTAKLWDPRRKGFIFNYKGHNGAINALRFSPDGRYLITASDDTAIRMWDVTAGKVIKSFQEHQGPVFAIEYHPRELLFASGGADRRIKFWDLEKLEFLCETEIETSAIKCLAFEPTNANFILSGSIDTLRTHTWEPIHVLDTVPMNWKNVLDMATHKDQLFGVSALQNKVCISSIHLSDLKTKRRPSPVRDYFPSDPKVTPTLASAMPTRRSQYQAVTVKDEHVKLQPEPPNAMATEEPQASVVDSVIISNQADYDRIFRGKSQVAVEAARTPSVSPPPQVDMLIPPIKMPPEQVFAGLSKVHHTIHATQQQRMRNIILLNNLSRTNTPQINFQTIVASHDLSLECFLLRFVTEKLTKRDWNLDVCTSILPAARDLVKSHYHWYNLVACQALDKILSGFGKMIYDNAQAKSIGVDLSQQARRDKCQSCHYTLHEIRCLLEDRLKHPMDSSVKQAFDDSLRLLNACERS